MHQLAADFASPDAGSSALIVEGVDVAAVEPALAGGALEEVVGGTGARILVIILHYGTKPGHFETSKIYFPTSEGVSE